MTNLEDPGVLPLLSEQLKKDIDAHCVHTYDDGPRSHLGASQIGRPCLMELWIAFRWLDYKVHDGRQYRLFQRGHFEEPRFVEYLEGVGCEVEVFAPGTEHIEDKGKRQIRISACQGHFGGSVDSVLKLPERYQVPGKVLGEYKTQGTQKFAKLLTQGCQINKEEHFAQQSIYGYKLGLTHSVYLSVNKNDDDLHVELIKLDWILGKELEDKAERIIFATEPPPKISLNPKHYRCGWCDFKGLCWYNKEPLVNCRSCRWAAPIADAKWNCEWHGIIPKEHINDACGKWESVL